MTQLVSMGEEVEDRSSSVGVDSSVRVPVLVSQIALGHGIGAIMGD